MLSRNLSDRMMILIGLAFAALAIIACGSEPGPEADSPPPIATTAGQADASQPVESAPDAEDAATEAATLTPIPEPTPPPAAHDPTPESLEAEATEPTATFLSNVNIRSGPGTEFEVIGQAMAGEVVPVYGVSNGWVQLDEAGTRWVGSTVVELSDAGDLIPITRGAGSETTSPAPVAAPPVDTSGGSGAAEAAATPDSSAGGGGGNENATFSGDEVSPAWWPCAQGQIKGNWDSMIFHVPGGRFYARTYEEVTCFNTADEAIAAGFRPSQR